ncbi:unnamed protein product [Urochloa humidicola]
MAAASFTTAKFLVPVAARSSGERAHPFPADASSSSFTKGLRRGGVHHLRVRTALAVSSDMLAGKTFAAALDLAHGLCNDGDYFHVAQIDHQEIESMARCGGEHGGQGGQPEPDCEVERGAPTMDVASVERCSDGRREVGLPGSIAGGEDAGLVRERREAEGRKMASGAVALRGRGPDGAVALRGRGGRRWQVGSNATVSPKPGYKTTRG